MKYLRIRKRSYIFFTPFFLKFNNNVENINHWLSCRLLTIIAIGIIIHQKNTNKVSAIIANNIILL